MRPRKSPQITVRSNDLILAVTEPAVAINTPVQSHRVHCAHIGKYLTGAIYRPADRDLLGLSAGYFSQRHFQK